MQCLNPFLLSLSSSHQIERGGKKSYELFMRKVTLRGHGRKPAVSSSSLPMSFFFALHSTSPLVTLNAKIGTFILGLNLEWIFCSSILYLPMCQSS